MNDLAMLSFLSESLQICEPFSIQGKINGIFVIVLNYLINDKFNEGYCANQGSFGIFSEISVTNISAWDPWDFI